MAVAPPRGELVGRIEERAALDRWLREALAGAPRVVMMTGEPGMGKTALLRWMADQARSRGASVAWGAALPGVDVPFLAASALLADVNGGTDALAVGERSDGPWGGRGSQHVVAATDAVRRAADRAPLLVVLDDLQWADEATAAFAHNLTVSLGTRPSPTPLLFAVAARDGDDDPDGPGVRAVRRLGREHEVRRLHVGPLDEVEVRELHRSITGAYPTASELRDVLDLTGGRPILVAAHAELLAAGAEVGTGRSGDPFDLLSGRLDRLPTRSRRALQTMAVVGDRMPVAAIAPLLGSGGEEELRPAIEAELLHDDGDALVFEHSLYRQAALHAMGATERERVAERVAAAVVSEPLRSEFGPLVVARQLRATPASVPLDVVADIRWTAGEEAYAAGAWGLAAEHLEGALAAAERAGSTWADSARRWYRAAEAAFRDIDRRCVSMVRRALSLTDVDDDPDLVAEATILLVRAVLTLGREPTFAAEEAAAAIALAGHPDPRLDRWRPSLYGVAAECYAGVYDVERGSTWAAEARAARARLSDEDAGVALSAWGVELSDGLQHLAGIRLDRAAECFGRAVAIAGDAGSPWHESSSRFRVDLVTAMRGRLADAERSMAVSMDIARACHHWSECSFGGGLRTVVQSARCEASVEAEAETAAAMHRRTEYVFSPPVIYPALAHARAVRGDLDGAEEALARLEALGHRVGPYRRSLQRLGHLLTGEVPATHPVSDRPVGALTLASVARLAANAEFCADLGDTSTLPAAAEQLDRVLAAGLTISPGWPYFLPRIRAQVAVALDERNAEELLTSAEQLARRERLEFELVQLDLLRSRRATGTGAAADRAADALRRADRIGLLTGVAAAQRRLRELGATAREPMARVVLNTDIVAHTDIVRSLGDEAWLAVLDEHDELVRSFVRRHGGVVFKHTGDGVYAWFVSAIDAVLAVSSLLAEFRSRRFDRGRLSLQIRAGLAMGTPMSRGDGDLFGLTVIEAARLCDAAPDGTALVSAAAAAATDEPLVAHGTLELKGFDAPVDTFRLDAAT